MQRQDPREPETTWSHNCTAQMFLEHAQFKNIPKPRVFLFGFYFQGRRWVTRYQLTTSFERLELVAIDGMVRSECETVPLRILAALLQSGCEIQAANLWEKPGLLKHCNDGESS